MPRAIFSDDFLGRSPVGGGFSRVKSVKVRLEKFLLAMIPGPLWPGEWPTIVIEDVGKKWVFDDSKFDYDSGAHEEVDFWFQNRYINNVGQSQVSFLSYT